MAKKKRVEWSAPTPKPTDISRGALDLAGRILDRGALNDPQGAYDAWRLMRQTVDGEGVVTMELAHLHSPVPATDLIVTIKPVGEF